MQAIEPCCTQKHWPQFRKSLGESGTGFFHGFGDLSLKELMPVIMTRYSEVEMIFVCPYLPDSAAATLQRWLHKTWARADGAGSINAIAGLTLVTDLRETKSPVASTWLTGNPFAGRLFLCNAQQNDTAIILPDLAIFGPVNLAYGGHFTAMVTKDAQIISDLRKNYMSLYK